MVRAPDPTPEQRQEMEDYIDKMQPGLIDELGVTRTKNWLGDHAPEETGLD